MAKSKHREADKVQRGQRIARRLEMQENADNDFRNYSRMGWKGLDDEDETEQEDELAEV